MLFHNRKLYLPDYRPAPFSYAVRRSPSHFPDGTLAIEQQGGTGGPIFAISKMMKTLVFLELYVGAAVGVPVGVGVGAAEGAGVGAALGLEVGIGVGAVVGVAVGATYIRIHISGRSRPT